MDVAGALFTADYRRTRIARQPERAQDLTGTGSVRCLFLFVQQRCYNHALALRSVALGVTLQDSAAA